MDIQIQVGQRNPTRIQFKRPTLRHMMMNLSKVTGKQRLIKRGKENVTHLYKGVPISQLISRNFTGQPTVL